MKLWIARDEDNTLKLHFTGPYRYCDHYNSCGTIDETIDGIIINDKLFPEVTFENSPQEVELKLVNDMASFAEDLHTNCKPLEGEFSKFVDDNFDKLI